MSILDAIILGLVQGITEFLPISSSGHLALFQMMLGFDEPPILFVVLVHLATLLAVIIYFRKRLLALTPRHILLIIVATIPAVFAGLIIEPYLETLFDSLLIVGLGLLTTAGMLWSAHKCINGKGNLKSLPVSKAFIVGIFQALAIIPGISRSGSTVSAGLSLDLQKSDAFYFSFLIAIPAILGAAILELKDITSVNQLVTLPNTVGFLTAMASGIASLKLLDVMLTKAKLHYFAIYCLVMSVVIIGYQIFQII